ncbi:MAG: MBL fold metallo-hydrolase [Candidatus Micrarchaeota archaeon]|nr:MBL fold metallo-hydrolase [Candidatus Micrarchaeota archaeon]MDE1834110.1 MBL fold metallo-hydrolase [Candidatus Micrarchaeota archaeon]MDE1859338.1 MBL fold metallo-hydrolase [Candidatus Micrarchaeota archaeon]
MDLEFLTWLGHASFLLNLNGKNVYIDPFHLEEKKVKHHADIILITHPHSDHLSESDIKLIADSSTNIFVPFDSMEKIPVGKVTGVEPNKHYSVDGVEFDTVPAYNHNPNKVHFHPKENKWVGYILDINGTKVYHAGDTDFIKEMSKINTNLAMLPMGGTYVMDLDEMIQASHSVKADKVAPIHYRRLLGKDGSKAAEKKFLENVKNGIILDEYGEPKYSF